MALFLIKEKLRFAGMEDGLLYVIAQRIDGIEMMLLWCVVSWGIPAQVKNIDKKPY